MRQFMRVSLFGLFLIGLSFCVSGSLLCCQSVTKEMGWRLSGMIDMAATRLDPQTQRYLAVWGTLVVVVVPISFAALDASENRRRRASSHTWLTEPEIDRIYEQRHVNLGQGPQPSAQEGQNGQMAEAPTFPQMERVRRKSPKETEPSKDPAICRPASA